MTASASTSPGAFVSSSSSSHPNWTYDVYLSFRGRDTRAGFVDHLCQALLDAGINTFRDEGLPIGEVFSSRLFSAMKGSRFVIVVFSRNYAASTWCLEELAKMMECQAVTGQRVLPIFYHVDPSDVRNQGGSFAEAFVAHEERYSLDKDKAHRWRAALRDVCNVLGRHVAEDTRESLVVREIVAEILKCTNQTMSSAAVFPQQALFNLEPPPSRIPIPSARSPTNISPTGRIRPVTTRCEKRKLLGHGSLASVYEGIAARANERVKPSSRKGSTTYLQARSPDLEVQLARMYRPLEFSGPKDFETSMSVWEARKVRPSSDIPRRLRSLGMCSPIREETKDTEESEAVDDLRERTADGIRNGDETEFPQADLAESSGCCRTVGFSGGEGGNGIKGVSPPPVLKPPPARKLPVTDNGCSNRDLFYDLALDNERGPLIIGCGSSSDEEEKDKEANVGEEEEEENKQATGKREVLEGQEDVVRHGDIAALSESRSFTTSNDDDSSGTTPGPTNTSPNERIRPDTTYWEKGNLLGRGSFGSVHEGIAANGVFFAIKEVSLLNQGSKGKLSIYQLEQEIALLSKFEHENIVQYYGTKKDESNLHIFLELVTQGSLLKVYQKFHLLDPQVSEYTRQILHGLKYLHDRNVVHRDIKCANILVDANGFVKLADFGLAKATKLNDLLSCKGTAFWMAPEVVNGKNQGYGLPADIWSLGCTVLEMLTREIPYSGLEGMAALFKIGKGERPPIPDSLSKDARDFVLQCLQAKAHDRPTAAQLLDHPFVRR